ncbi:hypothetical protein SRHO_G00329080 [Serrasalmus rhombeus]
MDTCSACAVCLGLQHAQAALASLGRSDSEEELVALIPEEEDDDKSFIPSAQASKPVASGSECSTADGSPHPTASMDLHILCKKLGIPWLEVFRETTMSRYEGERLLKAKCSERQLLDV